MSDTLEGGSSDDEPALDVTIISPRGELLLEVHDENRNASFLYRARTDNLRQSSVYFERLLHPDKFGEGLKTAEAIEKLKKEYAKVEDAPFTELPRVRISDVGKISKVSSIKNLVADFLRALHGLDLSTPSPPLANLANLAIVADRFDALPHFSDYARRHKYMQTIDGRSKSKGAILPEEKARQKLLVGVLLGCSAWVAPYSKQLIIQGSKCFDAHSDFDQDQVAMWWSLPRGIEEEMVERREYVLETLASIGSHFLMLYTSNERQCKLGYDSSVQCDSFQLGEMVRFLLRVNLLRINCNLSSKEESASYNGDIEHLLDTLRQCPSYQIDQNHSHCGLRAKLVPILDNIEPFLRLSSRSIDVGICGDCWMQRRGSYAWVHAKQPVAWNNRHLRYSHKPSSLGSEGCLQNHVRIRDAFMAVERRWTAQRGDDNGLDSRLSLRAKRI